MAVDRRAFLAGGGALAAAALLPGSLLAAIEREAARSRRPSAAPDLQSWAAVRGLFNLDPGWTHMSSFFFASHPKPVREAIDHYRKALDANPILYLEHAMLESEVNNVQIEVRRAAAEYVGGKLDEIALMPNTTTGLGLVYAGLPIRAGDEILSTTHDHYSHFESIRYTTERTRATVRRIPLYDRPAEASKDEIVARVRRNIRSNTRVLGVTWVHSSSGVRLPIRAIADAVAEANRGRSAHNRLLLVVDGVHGIGCSDVDIASLGADFFCAGTHKWLFGPRGTGIVWAPVENWRMMQPLVPNFSSSESFGNWIEGKAPPPVGAAQMSPGGFIAYEHQWGMRAAFQMHKGMGRARVASRIRQLNDRVKTGLASMRGITLHTPRDPELSAGISCFDVAGMNADAAAKRLIARKIVASSSPYGVSYCRLAPSLVNDTADVDRALNEVAAISRA